LVKPAGTYEPPSAKLFDPDPEAATYACVSRLAADQIGACASSALMGAVKKIRLIGVGEENPET
jgi:hypothetical protein